MPKLTPVERSDEREEAFRQMLDGRLANVWTALPGIVESFSASPPTVSVRLAVKSRVTKYDGKVADEERPLLVSCPVFFPSGGGVTLTFPIAKGDECLVVFSSRSIDAWWQSGGSQVAGQSRMHHLSDGFAFVGFRSQPRTLSNISGSTVQLRSDDGNTLVEVDAGGGNVNIKGKVNLNASQVQVGAGGSKLGFGVAPITKPTAGTDPYGINAKLQALGIFT